MRFAPFSSSLAVVLSAVFIVGDSDARFLSVDPGPSGKVGSSQSWNRYSYVQNSPLNHVDPTGMLDVKVNDHLTVTNEVPETPPANIAFTDPTSDENLQEIASTLKGSAAASKVENTVAQLITQHKGDNPPPASTTVFVSDSTLVDESGAGVSVQARSFHNGHMDPQTGVGAIYRGTLSQYRLNDSRAFQQTFGSLSINGAAAASVLHEQLHPYLGPHGSTNGQPNPIDQVLPVLLQEWRKEQ